MLVFFDPALWTIAPLTFPLVQAPAPTPLPKVKVQYILYRQCVAGRGWGVLSCVGDNILQEFNMHSVSDQIQNLQYKIALPYQSKTWEGRGASDR
jgi:hypothetical protein